MTGIDTRLAGESARIEPFDGRRPEGPDRRPSDSNATTRAQKLASATDYQKRVSILLTPRLPIHLRHPRAKRVKDARETRFRTRGSICFATRRVLRS